MNRIILLEQLRDFTKAATGDIILPVKEQKAMQEKQAGRLISI